MLTVRGVSAASSEARYSVTEGSVRLVKVAALYKQHGPFRKSRSGRAARTTMDRWRGRSPAAGTGDR
jgi:hypothetical protein